LGAKEEKYSYLLPDEDSRSYTLDHGMFGGGTSLLFSITPTSSLPQVFALALSTLFPELAPFYHSGWSLLGLPC
jgi:hypothetical protein